MDYIYTVDLDMDCLNIESCNDHYDSQGFDHFVYCLDNIPCWILYLPMVGVRDEQDGDGEDEKYSQYL